MSAEGQGGKFAVLDKCGVDCCAVKRPAPLADKKTLAGRFHASAFFKPYGNRPQLVTSQGVRGRKALFKACNVKNAALPVHLVELEFAHLGHAQPMPIGQKVSSNGRGPRCGYLWWPQAAFQPRVRSNACVRREMPRAVFRDRLSFLRLRILQGFLVVSISSGAFQVGKGNAEAV
jgi:hypothetical protein